MPEMRAMREVHRMNNPLVSIVIPSHPTHTKQQELVVQNIEQQTYPNLEVIIETGGNNAQEARNIAVNKANGEYIAMLDDDDTWHPEKIEKQVRFMRDHDDCGICLTYVLDERVESDCMDFTPAYHTSYGDLLRGFCIAPTSCFLIRRECFDKYGLFDESFRFAHEYELAIRFASNGMRIYCIPEYLTYYGINSAERLSDNYGDYIRGHFDLIGKWGGEMARESIIFSLLKQTLTFPFFLLGMINVELAHKFFYRVKRFTTRGVI